MFPSRLTNLLPLALSLSPFTTLWGEAPPTVQLDQATIYGTTNGSVTSYLNIPFAEPPYASFHLHYSVETDCLYRIGDLRLRLPKPIEHYNGTIDATQVGPQCIQQMFPLRPDMPAEMLRDVVAAISRSVSVEVSRPESEDCTS